jgi:hypothetical protein
MTITVKLPDGNTAQFPDGTPPGVMKQALAKYRTKPATMAPEISPEQRAANVAANADSQRQIDASTETRMTDPGPLLATVRSLNQGMSFGFGDELAAGVQRGMGMLTGNDEPYSEILARERAGLEAGRDFQPVSAYGGELTGAVAVPVGAAAKAVKAAAPTTRLGAALMPGAATLARTASLPLRIGTSIAAGATQGGLYGFGAGEGGFQNRMESAGDGALVGGLVGAAAPAIGAGVQAVANNSAARKTIADMVRAAPTTEALRAEGRAAYKAVDDAGVSIKPEAFSAARQKIVEALRGRGLDELPGPGSLTPMSARANQIAQQMDETLTSTPTASLPFKSVDQLRRHAGTAAGNMANKTDSAVGTEMVSQLDDFVNNLTPDQIDVGDAEALKTMLPKAREIWGRMSRSQTIDDAIDASENYLSGGASGIRNQFSRILKSDKLSRGFSDAEKALMRRVVNGSGLERLLNLAGGGLGQLGQIGAGFGAGGPIGALAGAGTAALTRRLSEGVSRKNAETVRAVIAAGGLKAMPQASEGYRKITEALTRRIGAVAPQMK